MPLSAFVIILLSALMHAGWNFLVKRATNKEVFMWWALLVGTLLYSPLLINALPVPVPVWPYALVSALIEVVYFGILTRAYERYDFSLVYPISRGAAPALLALWAVFFLNEELTAIGACGIALILLGVYIVGQGRLRLAHTRIHGVLPALTIALCISIYSVLDAVAVRMMAAAAYSVLLIGLLGLFFTPIVLRKHGMRALRLEWGTHWRAILAVGVLHTLAYLLVLQVYATSRVSYAGALREISVVFGALAGWLWQGETFGRKRTLGAGLIFLGIAALTFAR